MRDPIAASIASVAFMFTFACGAADQRGDSELRTTMHRAFEALTNLVPASLTPESFADPGETDRIGGWLEVLAEAADSLETHAAEHDASFRHLSRSLALDAVETRRLYVEGRHEDSRYILLAATQSCVACHNRLPSARDFPLAEKLTGSIEVASLSPRERAHFMLVTRSFDDALEAWESFFLDPEVTPIQMDTGWTFFDYLVVCIDVQDDLARAQGTLERVASREDMPEYLRQRLDAWTRALGMLREERSDGARLEQVRALVERTEGRDDPERMVYDLRAASLLNQYIADAREGDPGLPEAYYRLGIVEERTAQSYWIPMVKLHLETAVRLAPGGPFAQPAFELLENHTALAYGGLEGPHLPDDIRKRLIELRELMRAAG